MLHTGRAGEPLWPDAVFARTGAALLSVPIATLRVWGPDGHSGWHGRRSFNDGDMLVHTINHEARVRETERPYGPSFH
jgi:hypothetical protein